MSRTATCRCGRLSATATGEPVRVSICHCHACQQRSGSAFSWQARWPEAQVTTRGEAKAWQRTGDEGQVAEFSFCPVCGTTVWYVNESMPGVTAIPLGGMDGQHPPQDQPAPKVSVYENRLQPWLAVLGDDIERM